MSEIVESVEEVAGLYLRTCFIPGAFTLLPQHVHDYDHATLVCAGSVRVWIEHEQQSDYAAGRAVCIKAGKKHHFQTLEPNTRLSCIHELTKVEA
jgi:quercetin dioxygenase-like cupin family protein